MLLLKKQTTLSVSSAQHNVLNPYQPHTQQSHNLSIVQRPLVWKLKHWLFTPCSLLKHKLGSKKGVYGKYVAWAAFNPLAPMDDGTGRLIHRHEFFPQKHVLRSSLSPHQEWLRSFHSWAVQRSTDSRIYQKYILLAKPDWFFSIDLSKQIQGICIISGVKWQILSQRNSTLKTN